MALGLIFGFFIIQKKNLKVEIVQKTEDFKSKIAVGKIQE